MSRLANCFERLKQTGSCALVTYIVAGDYNPQISLPAMHALVAGGADVIELGYPFSDPAAEGVTIQNGHERSLANGTRLVDVLDTLAQFRETDQQTPVVLMGYLNPVEQMGYEKFSEKARASGADGVLIVDLPLESAHTPSAQLADFDLDLVLLSAPTTSASRALKIAKCSRGYLYCVTLKGLTGADSLQVEDVRDRVTSLRAHATMPICVGFGIKTPQQAAEIAKFADGVVIGSALVDTIGSMAEQNLSIEVVQKALKDLLRPWRQALDSSV